MAWYTTNNVYGSSLKKTSLYSSPITNNNYSYNYSSSVSTTYPKGLQNLTNTCYISAILQVLFPIIEEKDFPVSSKKQQQITYFFFQLKKSKDRDIYKTFKEVLEQRIQIVRGWDQQDSQQLLVLLLEELSKENPKPLKPGRADLNFRENQEIQKNWTRYIIQMQKLENSRIIDLFYGQIIRRFRCKNGHDKHNFDRYNHVSLSFTRKAKYSNVYYSQSNQSNLNITDMLNDFIAPEEIEDLQCQKCKRKMNFTKQTAFYSTPKYLILHLSRFMKGYYDNQKNDKEVQFDEVLIIKNMKEKQTKYKLIGLVNHIGSMNRGHYYANVLVDDQWYEMNDEKVYKQGIRSTGNISSKVYLLVYKKC